MRLLDRCVIVLFIVFAFVIAVGSASAEPMILSAAEAVTVIPADSLTGEFYGWHNGAGFPLGFVAELKNRHIKTPIRLHMSVNGSPILEDFLSPVTFATRGGGLNHWMVDQAPMDSYFNDIVGTIRVPGEYVIYADVPIAQDLAIRFEHAFVVEQYEIHLNTCLVEWNLVQVWGLVYSLWEDLPPYLTVTDDVGAPTELPLLRLEPGIGITEGLVEYHGTALTFTVNDGVHTHERIVEPWELYWCNDEGKGEDPTSGKG
jgi:hypothetical protein